MSQIEEALRSIRDLRLASFREPRDPDALSEDQRLSFEVEEVMRRWIRAQIPLLEARWLSYSMCTAGHPKRLFYRTELDAISFDPQAIWEIKLSRRAKNVSGDARKQLRRSVSKARLRWPEMSGVVIIVQSRGEPELSERKLLRDSRLDIDALRRALGKWDVASERALAPRIVIPLYLVPELVEPFGIELSAFARRKAEEHKREVSRTPNPRTCETGQTETDGRWLKRVMRDWRRLESWQKSRSRRRRLCHA